MDIITLYPHLLDPIQQTLSVIQQSVHDHACTQRKRQKICHRICRGQEERGICLIRFNIESVILAQDPGNVVHVAEAVVWLIG